MELVEIEGIVVNCLPIEEISDKFSKKVIAVETGGQYPETFGIEFINNRIDQTNGIVVGDSVTVKVALSGRAWQKDQDSPVKYFTTIKGVFLNKKSSNSLYSSNSSTVLTASDMKEESDDLPF